MVDSSTICTESILNKRGLEKWNYDHPRYIKFEITYSMLWRGMGRFVTIDKLIFRVAVIRYPQTIIQVDESYNNTYKIKLNLIYNI